MNNTNEFIYARGGANSKSGNLFPTIKSTKLNTLVLIALLVSVSALIVVLPVAASVIYNGTEDRASYFGKIGTAGMVVTDADGMQESAKVDSGSRVEQVKVKKMERVIVVTKADDLEE